MSEKKEELEKLAALALAPLVEVAWADGHVSPAEHAGVLDAAKRLGLNQHGDFCRATLRRWLHQPPPTEALDRWRRLLGPMLVESDSRAARKSEARLFGEACRIAKTGERPLKGGSFIDASVGVTDAEQKVLDDLALALLNLHQTS